jgi:tripartite-type tricarboxylate transporter receptor subunit TctC
VARILAPRLTASLGQPLIIENRTGANGAIGCAYVAGSAPDGYTLVINLGPSHQTLQLFTKGIKYDLVKDFTPIAMVAAAPQIVVVPAASPIRTVRDFVDTARRSEKGLSYGTSGIGTSQHLAGLLLANTEKLKLTHVAYRGGAPALTDVVGGQVDAGILVLSNALPYIETGKLRALGVVEDHRSRSAPSIPTLAEAGVQGFSVPDTWVGILGPAGMPAAVVQRLNAEIVAALRQPEVKAQMQKAGYEDIAGSSEAFATQLSSSVAFYKSIVDAAGIQPE